MDTFSLRGIKYALSKQEVLIRLQFYFVYQHVFRPSVFLGCQDVELSLLCLLTLGQNDDMFCPTDFCDQWLQNFID